MRDREFWPMPGSLHDVADDLTNLASVIAFTAGLASQGALPPGSQHHLSEKELYGGYLLLTFIEDHLDHCSELIMQELRAKKTEP